MSAKSGKPDLILGTAGHIDHGKSSLIMALTGTDPDWLQEEKKRGITIQLGFAQLELPDGRTMGVVDVPGHEKFIRQMIAGSTGIDVALLTVAADDGIMPQTIEHIAVLQTLAVPACVVALTKTDLVDTEWVGFMQEEIRTYLSNTAYADAAIVAVSSRTGAGLTELKQAIQDACTGVSHLNRGNTLRLPVDRSFSVKGSGTVVTGTLWSGTAHVDDVVQVFPSGITCRIRAVQEHGESLDAARAGNRVALNLNGVSTNQVRPGDFIAAEATLHPSDHFDVYLTYMDTANSGKSIESGSRMHVAHGTREALGRVLLFNGAPALAPGQSAYAQIRMEEPLPVSFGDRFVLRTYSPVQVVGGGQIVLAHPRRRTTPNDTEMQLLEALRAGDSQTAVERALALEAEPVTLDELTEAIGLQKHDVTDCLSKAVAAKHAITIGSAPYYTTQPTRQKLIAQIGRALIDFHAKNPDATGISKEALRRICCKRATPACFDALLDEAVRAGQAVVNGGEVGHPSAHGAAKQAEAQAASAILAVLKDTGSAPPLVSDLAKQVGVSTSVARKALATLDADGKACRITSELFFDRAVIDRCKESLGAHLSKGADGTVATLKGVLGMSRKYAVPVLEHFDGLGFTERDGDNRVLKHH